MGNDIVYCKKTIKSNEPNEVIKSIQNQINTIVIEQSNINKKLEKLQNQINEIIMSNNKSNESTYSIADIMQIQNDIDSNNKNILEIQNNINDMYVILKTNTNNIENMKKEMDRVLFFLKDPNKPSSCDSKPITIPPDMLQSQKDQLSLLYTKIKQNMNKKYYKGKENEESEDENDITLKPEEKELIMKWKREKNKKDKQEEKKIKMLQKKTLFEKRRSKIETNLNTLHLEADILRKEEDDENCNGNYGSTQIKNAYKDRQQEIREKREVLKRINIVFIYYYHHLFIIEQE